MKLYIYGLKMNKAIVNTIVELHIFSYLGIAGLRGEKYLLEWLLEYKKLEQQISFLKLKLIKKEQELNKKINGCNSIFEDDKEESLNEVNFLDLEIIEVENLKYSLIRLVDGFKGLDNKILKMKYVDGMTLEKIAEELGYSRSYIYTRHAVINKQIKFLEKELKSE